MKLNHWIAAPVLALSLALPGLAAANDRALAEPIVELMPHVLQLGAELNLSTEQEAALANWRKEASVKRKAMEQEALALREQLREAILNGESRLRREELKKAVAEKETRLIEIRALCTRELRNTLDEEQFAKVVASYRASR